MDRNLLYYLNNTKNKCVTIPSRKCDYLTIQKYLSEFKTNEEKLSAQDNLGITDKLKILKKIIDDKVIEVGGVSWDTEPTEGHTGQILSSDAVWRVLLNFKSNLFIDDLIQTLWNNILSKIDKISQDVKEDLLKFIPTFVENEINKHILDLLNQIDSLEVAGVAVSNEFGDNEHISISQKTLTEAINKLWQKIEEITGETLQGVDMQATPSYFIGEDGCSAHISATTVNTNGIFEHIAFYIDGVLIAEADNVESFSYDSEISGTSVIMCKAKIMGVEYTRQQVVTHYNSFFLGAGSSYTELMDGNSFSAAYAIPITNGMRGAHDVTCKDSDHIIIAIGKSLRSGFIRADLNSIEIPFVETEVTVDGKEYVILTSDNEYNAGTYNIDING